MKNCLLLLLGGWLAVPVVARAQALPPPTSYQAEPDSRWQRAARVRAFIDARRAQLPSPFLALAGIRRSQKYIYQSE